MAEAICSGVGVGKFEAWWTLTSGAMAARARQRSTRQPVA